MDLDNNKPFVWRKKYEEKGIKIDDKEIEAEARRRAKENEIELQKIKERQQKRELEYQQKLNDHEFLQRQKEAEQQEHWDQSEDDFVLKQHRHRSKIRIRDGRAKPIDFLAHYIDIFGAKSSGSLLHPACLQEEKVDLSESQIELTNPCDWFNGLRQSDLETLEPDIRLYMNADCEYNQEYWKDLLEITQNELSKLQAKKEQSEHKAVGASSDIHSAVLGDVMSLFEGKTIAELNEMEDEMMKVLRADNPSIDDTFYQSTLSRLRAYRAKTRLTLNHKKNLKRQKDKILPTISGEAAEKKPTPAASNAKSMQNDNDSAEGSRPEVKVEPGVQPDRSQGDDEMVVDDESNDDSDVDELDPEKTDTIEGSSETDKHRDKFEEARARSIKEYEEGRYSPDKLCSSQLEPGIICVNYEDEFSLLVHQRNKICNASSLGEAKLATMTSEERAFIDAASQGMKSQEESVFSCETAVRGPDNRAIAYAWADKYQPRKPRYFNRVHTGFEWNKYNQTHYDVDNPPPKVVQGYKFNIFYPDLIDKSKAPTFSITPCQDDRDFCVIRFSAGPPYEDIAFRIVNREWNNSHKSGYRCQFINNMLQLWFQFKRYRYRR